jgi:hypothetical protein
MFRPWRPFEFDIATHPELRYDVAGRTLRVHLIQVFGPKFELDIHFEGVAGLLIVDESVFQTSLTLGLPKPCDFDVGDFAPTPWPIWKEEATSRSSLYGDLGRISYKSMDAYYIVGCDTVMLLDVADNEPRVSMRGPNNSLERSRAG